jgi:hypothetical protein
MKHIFLLLLSFSLYAESYCSSVNDYNEYLFQYNKYNILIDNQDKKKEQLVNRIQANFYGLLYLTCYNSLQDKNNKTLASF